MDRLTTPGSGSVQEQLTLSEPARTLWTAIRNELDRLRRSHELRPENWMMGGGSILAARWRHRGSTDIDLSTSAKWQIADLDRGDSNVFTEAMKKFGGVLTGYRKGSIRMTFPKGKLHVYKVSPAPAVGQTVSAIDGQPFEALSTTQILAGKLLNRLSEAPARDLYDIVIAGRRDPEQLERAVNMLSPETQEEAAFIWHTRRGNIERDAIDTLMPLSSDEPLEVPPSQLVDAAIGMVEKSRYETIDLEPATPGRSARIAMVTARGESRRIVVPRAEIAEVLEGTGINHCLTARYIDIDSFVEALHTEREYPAARESPA